MGNNQKPIKAALYESAYDQHLLAHHFRPGAVVITTNLGGRGSDYKVDLESSPRGLHCIIAFNTDEERILQQAKGRAGRAGQPGSYQIIALEKLKQKQDPRQIVANLKAVVENDLWFGVYRVFNIAINAVKVEVKQSTSSSYVSPADRRKEAEEKASNTAKTKTIIDNKTGDRIAVLTPEQMKELRNRFLWWCSSGETRTRLEGSKAVCMSMKSGGTNMQMTRAADNNIMLKSGGVKSPRHNFYADIFRDFKRYVKQGGGINERLWADDTDKVVAEKLDELLTPHLRKLQRLNGKFVSS